VLFDRAGGHQPDPGLRFSSATTGRHDLKSSHNETLYTFGYKISSGCDGNGYDHL
jgi:hypothetical protein